MHSILFRVIFLMVPMLLTAVCIGQMVAVEWTRSFGGSYSDSGIFIDQRPDNSYFVAAKTGLADGDLAQSTGSGTLLLMGLDADGQMNWSHLIGGDTTLIQLFHGLATPDGNYVLVGRITIPEDGEEFYDADSDAWIVKVTPQGQIIWQLVYGGSGSDFSKHVTGTSDGGLIVMGLTVSNDGNIAPMSNSPAVWIVRLDTDGNELWQNAYGGDDGEYPANVFATNDGGMIYSASSYWSVDLEEQLVDIRLSKLDALGNLEWTNTYGGSSPDGAVIVEGTADGNFLLLGNSMSSDGDIPSNNGLWDTWVAMIDPTGEILWSNSLGGYGQDALHGFFETPAGFLLYGTSDAPNAVENTMYGGHGDIWLVEMSTSGEILGENFFGGSHSEWGPYMTRANEGFILIGTSMSSDLYVPHNDGYGDVWIVKLTDKPNQLGGILYADLDQDTIPGLNDPRMANRFVELTGTGAISMTNTEGEFAFAAADTGTYTVTAPSVTYFTPTPDQRTTTFTAPQTVQGDLDFAYHPGGQLQDLQVFITPIDPFRPGFTSKYDIRCKNIGTIPVDAILQLNVSSTLTIDSVSIPATTTNGNSLSWSLGEMQLFEERTIRVHVDLDSTVVLDTLVLTTASITPLDNDVVPIDNSDSSSEMVVGSFDPNDILVDQATLEVEELDGAILDYLIRFQNTGTDTAFTVAVENFLPENVDLLSFELIGTSHPVELIYLDFCKKLHFQFDNILLPDSNTNEAESHGYIRYRISPEPLLNVGDLILNQASIFFDFNVPVVTNLAQTVIVTASSLSENGSSLPRISLYPNPSSGMVNIGMDETLIGSEFKITDLTGRVIRSGSVTSSTMMIEMGNAARGTYVFIIHSEVGKYSQRLILQ